MMLKFFDTLFFFHICLSSNYYRSGTSIKPHHIDLCGNTLYNLQHITQVFDLSPMVM